MGSTSAGREGWGLWEASREPRGTSVRRKELDTVALLTQRCSEEVSDGLSFVLTATGRACNLSPHWSQKRLGCVGRRSGSSTVF